MGSMTDYLRLSEPDTPIIGIPESLSDRQNQVWFEGLPTIINNASNEEIESFMKMFDLMRKKVEKK
jgi:hypothetical protein